MSQTPYILNKKFLILLCAWCLCCVTADAQRFSCSFRGESLADALMTIDKLSDEYHIQFIFNDLEDYKVNATLTDCDEYEAVRKVIGTYPVKILRQGHNLFVESEMKTRRRLLGRLVDVGGNPVAYATISLFMPTDSTLLTGGVSNENGDFVIPVNGSNHVILNARCLGFKMLTTTVVVGDVGELVMTEQPVQLNAVNITQEQHAYELTSEGIRINVPATDLAGVGTLADMLWQLPGIIDIGGEYYVAGRGVPTVYVNGRRVRNNGEINRLLSTDVKSVAVNTHPNAEYDLGTLAVIDVRTLDFADGLNGNLSVRAVQADKTSYGIRTDLTYHNRNLEVYGGVGYADSCSLTDIMRNEVFWLQNSLAHTGVRQREHSRRHEINGTIGAEYALGNHHTLGLHYSFEAEPYSRKDRHATTFRWYDKSKPTNIDILGNNNSDNSFIHDATAYYYGKLGKLGLSVSTDLFITKSPSYASVDEHVSSGYEKDMSVSSTANVLARMFAYRLAADYPLWCGRLTAGYEMIGTKRTDAFNIYNIVLPDEQNRVKETTNAVFVSYRRAFDRVDMDAGVRVETNESRYYLNGDFVPSQSRRYYQLFPQLSFTMPVGQSLFTLSYMSKTNRPTYQQQRNNLTYVSRYNYERGNPYLHPAIVQSISLEQVNRWFVAGVSLCHTKDCVLPYMYQYGTNSSVIMSSFTNLSHLTAYNLYLSASPKLGFWQMRWNLNLYAQHLHQPCVNEKCEIEHDKHFGNPMLQARLYSTFALGHGYLLAVDIMSQTYGHYRNQRLHPYTLIDCSLQKRLGQWTFRLEGNNLLRSRIRTDRFDNTVHHEHSVYNDTQNVCLHITYQIHPTHTEHNYHGSSAGKEERERL